MTSRERVRAALRFEGPDRIPRDLWTLPWAEEHYPSELAEIRRRYPSDIVAAPSPMLRSSRVKGDPYAIGSYTDEWGCVFVNIQRGAIGEVRDPIVPDLAAWRRVVSPPYETLTVDSGRAREEVNRFCGGTGLFVLAEACPRPWERYQFLRGTTDALMDVALMEGDAAGLLDAIHHYYLAELAFWTETEVDAIRFMDDWGSQNQLLISPASWRRVFKPLYREYAERAHEAGKFIFMHSDGNIEQIYPDLVEIGIDAVNSQLFCMDRERLAAAVKGKITFWGEIDRQQILPSENAEEGRRGVRELARHLYDPSGGIIAQCEFGLAANPAVVAAVFEEWDRFRG